MAINITKDILKDIVYLAYSIGDELRRGVGGAEEEINDLNKLLFPCDQLTFEECVE